MWHVLHGAGGEGIHDLPLLDGADEDARSARGESDGEQPAETARTRDHAQQQQQQQPPSLTRNGREYQLVATASDGSALYESRLRRREFWLQRAEGGERPWNYVTRFGLQRKTTCRPGEVNRHLSQPEFGAPPGGSKK